MRKSTSPDTHHWLIWTIGLFAALSRLPDLNYPGECLWAEDGNVFIHDVFQSGLHSLGIPYAGYLHLYPRLIALLSSWSDLPHLPYLFFLGWCLAALAFIGVIGHRAHKLGIPPYTNAWLMALIFLQPHYGEIFYALCNAQWVLAPLLGIYILTAPPEKPGIWATIGITIAALTGPFSVLISPLVLLRQAYNPAERKKKLFYTAFFLAVFLQTFLIIHSERALSGSWDLTPLHWLKAIFNFLKFGSRGFNIIAIVSATLFWGSLISALRSPTIPPHRRDAIFLLLLAGIFFLSSLWLLKSNPATLSPLGDGARYYFPTYALILFAGVMLTSKLKTQRALFLLSFSVLSFLSFTPKNSPHLSWEAYAHFAEKKSGVSIPIQIFTPHYPSWHVEVPASRVHEATLPPALHPNVSNPTVIPGKPTEIHFEVPTDCARQNFMGITLEVFKSQAGVTQWSWTPEKKIQRYYPAGVSAVHFAVKIKEIKVLNWIPDLNGTPFELRNAEFYCF